ncbi:hypothetical protein [Pseudoxanthomonas sacheonensis]|uniref:hypothetical protein n=1 Tax=Pseudoxanthomonas sacheonensis TaxID=443615 RepID=UPI0013D0FC7C|nr:hypothetical protein [Pseudoxanthomonas sacheonensis]KAF1711595.1 hypothetical protein CSC73_02255 [Pseudoxanthomonas sacheonensis]
MRINRITLSLACVLATGPCLAGSTEASVQGHDADGLPAAGTAAFVLVDGVADSDKLPDSLLLDGMHSDSVLFGKEIQPAAPVAVSSDEVGNPSIGIPVDAGELDRLRGGESTVDNDVLIDGTVEGNTADHIVSGANVISDGSFANGNGINTVIQNTGSNVLIQNGMVVNVQFVAPTP